MNQEIEEIIKAMRARGKRVTPQRIAILRFLMESKSHPTAQEIYAHVRREYPTITISTVYNALEMLVDIGMAMELGFSGLGSRYEANTRSHINLVCKVCGRIEDVENVPLIDDMRDDVKDRSDFEILGQRMEFYGLCGRCKKVIGKDK
jgi:Fur family peroxide stress response transcriptional regulator